MRVSFIRERQHISIKFEPYDLKPFDKVLYLENYTGRAYHWRIGFFERYVPKEKSGYERGFFNLMGDKLPMNTKDVHFVVIPAEGNERFIFEDVDIDYVNVFE